MVDSTVSLAGNVSDHYFLGIMVRVCWQSNMSVFQSTALADRVVAKLSPINLIIQSGHRCSGVGFMGAFSKEGNPSSRIVASHSHRTPDAGRGIRIRKRVHQRH